MTKNEGEITLEQATAVIKEVLGNVPERIWMTGGAGCNYDPEEWSVGNISARSSDNITLHVKRGNTSMGCKLSQLGERWFLTHLDAEERAAYLRETYIAKEGQFNCKYCRRATDNANKVHRTIVSRMYKPSFKKTFEYCSIECGGRDQMAHEG